MATIDSISGSTARFVSAELGDLVVGHMFGIRWVFLSGIN